MQKTKDSILFFLFLSIAWSQMFAGGLIPHLYTGVVRPTITSIGAGRYSQTLDRMGVFNAGQQVHIATSIIDFGYVNTFGQSFTSSVAVAYNLKIAILNLAVSSNGNVFSFDLQTKSNAAGVDTQTYIVKTLGLNYIIIGEKTSGYYDDLSPALPSTYLYAKNSQFVQLQSSQQLYTFTFKTGTDTKSPFNNPNQISEDVGCGTVKRSQGWVIQRNCDLLTATLFITGFQLNIPNGQTFMSSLNFGPTNSDKQKNLKSSSATFSSSSSAGIPVKILKNLAVSVQISMVVLGIRQYTNNYPQQGIKIDDFKAATLITHSVTISNGFVGDLSVTPPIYFHPNGNIFDQKKVGHRLCGLGGLSYAVSPTSYPKKPVGFKVSIDIGNWDFDLEIDPKQDNIIKNEIKKQKLSVSYNCVFFTSKLSCDKQSSSVTLTSLQLAPSSNKVVAQQINFPSTYPRSGDPYIITPNDKILGYFEQTFSDAASVTYTFNVDPSSIKAGPYEGVLYVAGISITGLDVYQNLRIKIFGTPILQERKKVQDNQIYHFAFYNTNTNIQEIVITYEIQKSSTLDPTKVPTQRIQFGMIYHSKILSSTYQCVSLCPAITGKQTGIDFKTIPPKCIYCETSLNFEFDSLAGDCKCIDGFYKDMSNPSNPICKPCTIISSLCAKCTSSNSNCEQCVSNAQIDPNTKQCKCLTKNFYQSGNQCLPCPFGCQTCRSDSLCLTCVANSQTRQNTDKGCKCLAGYYEAGTEICPKCSVQCKTCKGAANICESCADDGEVEGTTCKCKEGYYFAVVEGNGKCLKCHFSCRTCSQDAAKCLECPSKQWTKQENRCICNKLLKYVYYSNVVIDSICVDRNCVEIDPNCVNCLILLESGNKQCSQCNEKENWALSPDNKACVCKFGFYLDQASKSKCLPCSPGCQTCTSQSSCSQCALGSNNNKNGECFCNAGYFVKQLSQGLICAPCDRNCARCVNLSDFCSQCINGFKSQNNKCVCKQGSYQTTDGINCLPCSPGCQKCSNAYKCDKCGSGYLTSEDGQKCIYNCPVGTYNAGSSCQKCSDGCKSCTNFINCKYCQEGLLNYLGSCRISCPTGTLPLGNTCIACSPICRSCSINPNNCTDCPSNSVRHNNQCVQSCPDKTFYNGISCAPCVSPCVNCISESKCKSCPPSQYLYQQKCYTTCPTALVNGICTDICSQGTFLSGKYCTNCHTQCKTCTSFNNCTSCKGSLVAYAGSCVQSCPKNTIPAGPVCLDCDPACNGCSGTATSCIECKANFYRLRDKCYSSCPEFYYPQFSSKSCKNCDSKCKVCSGPGQCSICIDGKAPTGGLCEVQCGANCLECRNSICFKCAQSYYWTGTSCQNICPSQSNPSGNQCVCSSNLIMHSGNCVFSCPQGYTKINNECKICNSPCKTCQKTSTTCTSCIDGYVLDGVNKKCSQKISCPKGQYRSHFGQCKYICQAGTYYLDSICYFGKCPSGYQYDDQRRICTKQNPLTGCCQPYFLQGSVCVNNCDPGFYPDLDTRVCTCCPINCLSCTGPQKCTSCHIGSILTGNICTINPDGCPNNQYRFNEICVSSCPSGTYNKNGFCIKLCNSGLYYWNGGCYQTCPTNLCTPDACIVVCPVGYTKSGNKCLPSLISCKAGQFFNAALGVCENCRYPCASCAGSSSYCTSCVNGFSVKSGSCFSDAACPVGNYPSPSGCLKCQSKCSTCSDQNVCTSCATGYVNTGADCIQSTTNLQTINLQIVSIVRKDLIVLIQIKVSILPNQLAGNIMSQILLFVPNIANPCAKVNIWIQNNFIYVALTHEKYIPSYQTLLIFNSNLLDSIYRSMGYSTANAFCQASISSNIQLSNTNFNIPYTVMNSRTFSNRQIERVYNSRLNRESMRALSSNERAV